MPDDKAPRTREEQARDIVRRNVYWAMGLGLVPVPLVDLVALTAVQVKMLKALSDLYGVPFSDHRARTAVWSLVTGSGSVAITTTLAHTLFKVVPGLGVAVGFLGVPLLGGALTQAIGNLFVMHYESGGTLLSFDAEAMRQHFREELRTARRSVRRIEVEPKEPIAP